MGGNWLLEARRGRVPLLAAVRLSWSCSGKCSMDYSLPGDALPGHSDGACGVGWG